MIRICSPVSSYRIEFLLKTLDYVKVLLSHVYRQDEFGSIRKVSGCLLVSQCARAGIDKPWTNEKGYCCGGYSVNSTGYCEKTSSMVQTKNQYRNGEIWRRIRKDQNVFLESSRLTFLWRILQHIVSEKLFRKKKSPKRKQYILQKICINCFRFPCCWFRIFESNHLNERLQTKTIQKMRRRLIRTSDTRSQDLITVPPECKIVQKLSNAKQDIRGRDLPIETATWRRAWKEKVDSNLDLSSHRAGSGSLQDHYPAILWSAYRDPGIMR